MYRYMGNKTRLLPRILAAVRASAPSGATVADLMCGTGAVAEALRAAGYRVIASDTMTYAVHHAKVRLTLSSAPLFEKLRLGSYFDILDHLQNLPAREGFYFREYSPAGRPVESVPPRMYFSADNARRLDSINGAISEWQSVGKLAEIEHALLRHDLIMAANRVANIAGTYGHYRSTWSKASLSPLLLKPSSFLWGYRTDHVVLQGRAEDVSCGLSADVLYLDPPYMKRQYAANYHLIETIARGDEPPAIGVSGLRPWRDQYSDFCTKTRILAAFEKVLSNLDCRTFVVSYSEDGLLKKEQLLALLNKYGDVQCHEFPFNRFKSNNSGLGAVLREYIFVGVRRVDTTESPCARQPARPPHALDAI